MSRENLHEHGGREDAAGDTYNVIDKYTGRRVGEDLSLEKAAEAMKMTPARLSGLIEKNANGIGKNEVAGLWAIRQDSRKDARGKDPNDELTTVMRGTPERGVPIPAPKDPAERAAWEKAVAARRASGAGKFVGDASGDKENGKDVKSGGYNEEAVNNAISQAERRGGKVGGRERSLIHSLLKGRND